MELSEWSDRIEGISAGYADYFRVDRTPEWTLLKLTEELGELTQAYLAQSGQGRNRGKSATELRADVEAEVADVLAMVLVFARRVGVDVEETLTAKWLPWEEFHARRAAGEAPEPLAHRWADEHPDEAPDAPAPETAAPSDVAVSGSMTDRTSPAPDASPGGAADDDGAAS